MREIKFRAWDNLDRIMFLNHSVSLSIGGEIFFLEKTGEWVEVDKSDGRIILMQYTGLKDKNGKEIYEGDVLRFNSYSLLDALLERSMNDHEGVIRWDDERVGFNVFIGDKSIPDLSKSTDDNQFEIIGNIYENADLLTP